MKQSSVCTATFFCCALALLSSCGGGGGGGDDFVGAGLVTVRSSPSTIDTGDRMLVTAEVSDLHENGILLKFRYPAGLDYVLDSAELLPQGTDNPSDIGPAVNAQQDGETFLVFFLQRSQFGSEERGTVSFQLEGIDRVQSGEIEVDADVNDPLVDDSAEFDPESPEFGAEDATSVSVTS